MICKTHAGQRGNIRLPIPIPAEKYSEWWSNVEPHSRKGRTLGLLVMHSNLLTANPGTRLIKAASANWQEAIVWLHAPLQSSGFEVQAFSVQDWVGLNTDFDWICGANNEMKNKKPFFSLRQRYQQKLLFGWSDSTTGGAFPIKFCLHSLQKRSL